MPALERRGPRAFFPELADLLDWPFGSFRPAAAHTIRVEDYVDDGKYVVRAELPGIDPETDVDITVRAGVLEIRAERKESRQDVGRSEFRYGAFSRSLTLPAGSNEEDVKARYQDGILEITVNLHEPKPQSHKVPVETTK